MQTQITTLKSTDLTTNSPHEFTPVLSRPLLLSENFSWAGFLTKELESYPLLQKFLNADSNAEITSLLKQIPKNYKFRYFYFTQKDGQKKQVYFNTELLDLIVITAILGKEKHLSSILESDSSESIQERFFSCHKTALHASANNGHGAMLLRHQVIQDTIKKHNLFSELFLLKDKLPNDLVQSILEMSDKKYISYTEKHSLTSSSLTQFLFSNLVISEPKEEVALSHSASNQTKSLSYN